MHNSKLKNVEKLHERASTKYLCITYFYIMTLQNMRLSRTINCIMTLQIYPNNSFSTESPKTKGKKKNITVLYLK